MTIIVFEHQHLNNNHICTFCKDPSKRVVGRAYSKNKHDYPKKYYLFSYCEKCGIRQANKMVKVISPIFIVVRENNLENSMGPEPEKHEVPTTSFNSKTVNAYEFTQGVCFDGAVILKNGSPIPIEDLIEGMNALALLVIVKNHKDEKGKDDWYKTMQPIAWVKAKEILLK